jgi:hypothetical protein
VKLVQPALAGSIETVRAREQAGIGVYTQRWRGRMAGCT